MFVIQREKLPPKNNSPKNPNIFFSFQETVDDADRFLRTREDSCSSGGNFYIMSTSKLARGFLFVRPRSLQGQILIPPPPLPGCQVCSCTCPINKNLQKFSTSQHFHSGEWRSRPSSCERRISVMWITWPSETQVPAISERRG